MSYSYDSSKDDVKIIINKDNNVENLKIIRGNDTIYYGDYFDVNLNDFPKEHFEEFFRVNGCIDTKRINLIIDQVISERKSEREVDILLNHFDVNMESIMMNIDYFIRIVNDLSLSLKWKFIVFSLDKKCSNSVVVKLHNYIKENRTLDFIVLHNRECGKDIGVNQNICFISYCKIYNRTVIIDYLRNVNNILNNKEK
jgi:hypothetical protein